MKLPNILPTFYQLFCETEKIIIIILKTHSDICSTPMQDNILLPAGSPIHESRIMNPSQ